MELSHGDVNGAAEAMTFDLEHLLDFGNGPHALMPLLLVSAAHAGGSIWVVRVHRFRQVTCTERLFPFSRVHNWHK